MSTEGNFSIMRNKVRNILVRGTNWVGDAVMTLPTLSAVRQNFPQAKITVLAKPWVEGVYAHCPDVDSTIIFDQQAGFLGSRYAIIKKLRNQRFDLAILLPNSFDAALITFLAGIPWRVGYNTDGRSWLLTHRAMISKEILRVHQVHYYLGILKAIGCSAESSAPRITICDHQRDKANRYLSVKGYSGQEPLLGFNPGAFFGSAKRWFPDRFAAVADRAAKEWGARCIIFGSTHDLPAAREMASRMETSPILAAGETRLDELPGLLSRCLLLVTNDSGLMHMAAAVGVRVIAIFGSTDPKTTAPYGDEHTVIRSQVPCSPCLLRDCPTDHRCMKAISVDDVWQAMVEKMEEIKITR